MFHSRVCQDVPFQCWDRFHSSVRISFYSSVRICSTPVSGLVPLQSKSQNWFHSFFCSIPELMFILFTTSCYCIMFWLLWFLQHLRTEAPPTYEEMSCDSCMQSHDFLHAYKLHTVATKLEKEDGPSTEEHLEVGGIGEKNPNNPSSCCTSKEMKCGCRSDDSTKPKSGTGTELSVGCELARRRKVLAAASSSAKSRGDMVGMQPQVGRVEGAGFFQSDWRQQLCRCPACMVRVTLW